MQTESRSSRLPVVWSLLSGCVVGLLIGSALAYLSALPFFLGLFFFPLFGLIVGATMYRFGRPAIPAPTGALWIIGIVVVMLVWTTSIAVEYVGLPRDTARAVIESIPRRLEPQERRTVHVQTRRHVLSLFVGQDVQGSMTDYVRGFPGYLKWVLTDGALDCPRVLDDSTHRLRLAQPRTGWRWGVRTVLSLFLLAFAILSQVLGLAQVPESPDEVQCLSDASTGPTG